MANLVWTFIGNDLCDYHLRWTFATRTQIGKTLLFVHKQIFILTSTVIIN